MFIKVKDVRTLYSRIFIESHSSLSWCGPPKIQQALNRTHTAIVVVIVKKTD